MKKFCNECNRNTQHTKKKVGSDRESLGFIGVIFTIVSGGMYLIYHFLFSKTNYYDIFCNKCGYGQEGTPGD